MLVTSMRIIIVGAGMVGTQLARHLVQEKHDVSLIECSEERARHASNRIDCLVLQEQGNSIAALQEAGLARADALVCVTGSDELNMITCGLAESLYPNVIKIARVQNEDYARLNQALGEERLPGGGRALGIDYFIHPTEEAAKAVLRSFAHGAAGNVLSFEGTPYELGSTVVEAKSPMDGLKLTAYRNLVKGESLVILVERKGISFLPSGAASLEAGDRLYVLARSEDIDQIFAQAGKSERPLRRIGIVGGGRLGCLIAEGLSGKGEGAPRHTKGLLAGLMSLFKTIVPAGGRRITLIEQDYQVCKDLAARFPDCLVLNEDISDESFVAEERLGSLDLIITATANQELNMITAIYLKSRGVRRAIAMVTGQGYAAIARQLGVDVVIPLKNVVVESIVSKLSGGGIKGIHMLASGDVGVLEIEIAGDSPAVDKPITDFKLSAGGLVMLATRPQAAAARSLEETSFIPRGDYVFRAGDRIVLAAKNGSESEIEKFFGAQKGPFQP
ncbi:MAG: NAD-binding protein [Treponema sp.]|jgi:trk system potassium uptake protein TrkA|nr:NAD-binding protein [Treponema sp.]